MAREDGGVGKIVHGFPFLSLHSRSNAKLSGLKNAGEASYAGKSTATLPTAQGRESQQSQQEPTHGSQGTGGL